MKYRAKPLWCAAIAGAVALILARGASCAFADGALRGRLDEHAMFAAVGAMYSIDPQLLEAIAAVESAGRADAVSPRGAQGLMQLMPATARRFRVANPYDPVDSALGAARFIAWLRLYMAGNSGPAALPAMLAAYNAGPGAVVRYNGVPPYPETREYVRRVLWMYMIGAIPREPGNLAHPAHLRVRARISAGPDRLALERLRAIRAARQSATRDVPAGAGR